jgi:hypothetical protein
MNIAGSAIFMVSIGLLVIIGAIALNDLHQEATSSNDANIQQQASVSVAIEKPLLMLFSYGAIILGAFCAINAYAKM